MTRAFFFVVLMAGCGTPRSRCEKYLRDFDRRAENCGIATAIKAEIEGCTRDPVVTLSYWRKTYGSIIEAETCAAMNLRWETLVRARIAEEKKAAAAANEKAFHDAFRKALEDANKK